MGGTDICSAFVTASSISPLYAGEIQCRALGVNVHSFDENGNARINEVGELVITDPMPSMPLYIWNDKDNQRYKDTYFDIYPGVWRQGDWISINERGGCVIYGRSDATINRNGVRMGTSEIYRAVEGMEEVQEALVVDLEFLGKKSFLLMFVVLKEAVVLTDELKERIKEQVRKVTSKRHAPDEIYAVNAIPKTLNGKKMEVPIRKLLLGRENHIHLDTVANPDSIAYFVDFAKKLQTNEIYQ